MIIIAIAVVLNEFIYNYIQHLDPIKTDSFEDIIIEEDTGGWTDKLQWLGRYFLELRLDLFISLSGMYSKQKLKDGTPKSIIRFTQNGRKGELK